MKITHFWLFTAPPLMRAVSTSVVPTAKNSMLTLKFCRTGITIGRASLPVVTAGPFTPSFYGFRRSADYIITLEGCRALVGLYRLDAETPCPSR